MNQTSLSRNFPRSRRAFTLVELLVVMAIIAVLVSMLFPTFQTIKEQGRMIICQGNLKALHQAFMAYAQDHKGQFARNTAGGAQNYDGHLSSGWINGNQTTGSNSIQGITSGTIFPYVNDIKVFVCPSAALTPDTKGNKYVRSYSLSDCLGFPRTTTIMYNGIVNDDTGNTTFYRAESFNQVARPSQTLMLVESNDNGDDGYYSRSNKGNMISRFDGDRKIREDAGPIMGPHSRGDKLNIG